MLALGGTNFESVYLIHKGFDRCFLAKLSPRFRLSCGDKRQTTAENY